MTEMARRFCTPPAAPPTQADADALATAGTFSVPFGDGVITGYTWGAGPTVLLAHGWGSRASHLALLARHLAAASFRVVAFDAPAHSSRPDLVPAPTSNLFEFARALAAVARSLGTIHGVAAHSLGAAAAAFVVAGAPLLEADRFGVPRLILISAPASVESIIGNFARRNGLQESAREVLSRDLESAFRMSVPDYSVGRALCSIRGTRILLLHDRADAEFPVGEALETCRDAGAIRLVITERYGHSRILASRGAFEEIREFLAGP